MSYDISYYIIELVWFDIGDIYKGFLIFCFGIFNISIYRIQKVIGHLEDD